jgi:hypothetical protein
MVGNHDLFVGWDNTDFNPASLRADLSPGKRVGGVVKFDTEPSQAGAYSGPNCTCAFTDSAREYQAIQPAQTVHHHCYLPCHAEREEVQGLGCARVFAGQQRPHIVGYAGNAKETGLSIQQAFYILV